MSGFARSSQASRIGKRTLMELTLKVAIVVTAWKKPRRSGACQLPAGRSADRERVAAAARGSSVRILDLERGTHEVLDEVDFRALHQLERDGIDHQAHAVALEDEIIRLSRLVEAEAVLESGAAAAGDREAQEGVRPILLLLQLSDAPRRALAQAHALRQGSRALGHG